MELVFALLNLLAEEIVLDAKIIVGLLKDPDLANNSNAIIVANYRESRKENFSSLYFHYYRKANKRVDARLAGCPLSSGFCFALRASF